MLKKLFLGLIIACSCNISNVNSAGIFSQDTNEFHNAAIQIINNYNVLNQPLSSEDNQFLFNTYSNEPYTLHGGLLMPKSCNTLYDALLSFAIDMRVRSILANNEFVNNNEAIELIDFGTMNISNHIQQVVSDLCDRTEYGKTHNIYFDNNKLMIKKK